MRPSSSGSAERSLLSPGYCLLTTLLILRPVGPGLGDEVGGAQERLERAGVRPPAFQLVPGHLAPLDVGVVHVRDFELAAPRRLERLDDAEDVAVVHVDADDRVVRLRLLRLLLDADHAAAVEFGDAEALRVVDLLQEYLGAAALVSVRAHGLADVALDDVVAQDDADRLAVGERLAEVERRRDAALALLIGVVEVAQAEVAPVLEELEEVAGGVAARDDHDVGDPGVDERLDGVVDHRL